MKKLLILGGSRFIKPVIEAAHELDCYVITCDHEPSHFAHHLADEYRQISVLNKEEVLAFAKEENIDGIMSFACDAGVTTAAYVAEKMSLPSCGPYESVSILQNKKRFRDFLRDNGFNVPRAAAFSAKDEAMNGLKHFKFPIIVKPVDSAGSKGVSRVDSPDEFEDAYLYAMNYSNIGEIIVEEFIEKRGDSSDTDCFSVDGELKFISFSNQKFDSNAENPYAPAAYTWPSNMSEDHQTELAHELQRLLSLLNMKSSIYNIETREGLDGKAYIMECTPRGGGNRLAEMLEFATGVDLIKNSVRVALGMPVDNLSQNPYKGYWAIAILHSKTDGLFSKVELSEGIREYVKEIDLWVSEGEWVRSYTGGNEAIGTMIFCFENTLQMNSFINNLDQHVSIITQ